MLRTSWGNKPQQNNGGGEKRFTRWSHKPKTSGSIPVLRNQYPAGPSALAKGVVGVSRMPGRIRSEPQNPLIWVQEKS